MSANSFVQSGNSPPANRSLLATAHHEAGHAVIRWRLGLRFRKITIVPDAHTLGYVEFHRPPKWFDPSIDPNSARVKSRCEKEIISSFAGQIAEKLFLGRRPRFGMHADNQAAVDLGLHLCEGKTLDAFLHYLFLQSADLVALHWREIAWVAEELLRHPTLSYKEVLQLKGSPAAHRPAIWISAIQREGRMSAATDVFQEMITDAVRAAIREEMGAHVVAAKRLLSAKDGAIYLALSKREVYNMMGTGELKHVSHGKRKMLDIQDPNEWIDRRKVC